MKWLILLVMSFNLALAGDCDPINLVTEPNSPFKKIPTTDQDGSNTCYAFTAAQQMNYYLLKKGDHRLVHPAWAALASVNRGTGIGALWASSPELSIWGVIRYGNCSKDYIETQLRKWGRLTGTGEARFLALLDTITYRVNEKKDVMNEKLLKEIVFSSTKDQSPSCDPHTFWDQLGPALKTLDVVNSDQMLKEIIFPDCKKNPQKLNLPYAYNYKQDVMRMTLVPKLNKAMDENRVPISIGYCSRMLKDPAYQGLLPPIKGGNTTPVKEDCGNHASLLVGKKKIGGACHFLLRNSWGTGFNKTTKNYKCLCKNIKTGAYVDECTEETHNNGEYQVDSCWIPARNFPLNLFKYSILK